VGNRNAEVRKTELKLVQMFYLAFSTSYCWERVIQELMNQLAVRAIPATVQIGLGLAVEGYLFPDGTFRYGLEYLSLLLGYAENYLSQISKKSKKKLSALQGIGFTGYQIKAHVSRLTGGASYPQTLSFDDFCILVEYEATEVRNPKAIALLTAAFREVLRSRTQEAFGLHQDSFQKKIAFFQLAYEEREAVLMDDREDVENLELFGNEELGYFESYWEERLEKLYVE